MYLILTIQFENGSRRHSNPVETGRPLAERPRVRIGAGTTSAYPAKLFILSFARGRSSERSVMTALLRCSIKGYEKRSEAVAAMVCPIAMEAVAAGDGALSTWTMRSALSR